MINVSQDQQVLLYLLYVRNTDGTFGIEEIFTSKVQAESYASGLGCPVPSSNAYIRERMTYPHDNNV